jgi:hypothetical protein
MIKTAEYIQFEEGFLKVAAEHGCDIPFLRGYIKEADDIVEKWAAAWDELAEESKDPLYKTKVAMELIRLSQMRDQLYKKAGAEGLLGGINSYMSGMTGGGMGEAQNWLQGQKWMPEGISGYLKSNPNALSGMATGGVGGGLIGLLLGALMKHPMMGMMLGGLGGAGLGAMGTNQNFMSQFNKPAGGTPPKAEPAPTSASPAPGAAPVEPPPHVEPPVAPVANPPTGPVVKPPQMPK